MLSKKQQSIIRAEGNVVVLASAGTGKTSVLVEKIIYDLEKNNTFKSIAAMTFTIKAALEIKNRLRLVDNTSFIGTLNTFVLEEVINPFFKDVYQCDEVFKFDIDYDAYTDGIDSTVKFAKETGVIRTKIRNRSNKSNIIFQLALEIVKKSKACRLFLKSKYFKIFVDEYQDCDAEMHNFFRFLNRALQIELFIVGDSKQSIYMWRGANPAFIQSFEKDKRFKAMTLYENFRSCKALQNFSYIFDSSFGSEIEVDRSKLCVKYIKTDKTNWAYDVSTYIDTNSCAILGRSNNNMEYANNQINLTGKEFYNIKEPQIHSIYNDTKWLYIELAKVIILPRYSVHELLSYQSIYEKLDKLEYNKLKRLIASLKRAYDDKIDIYNWVVEIADFFGLSLKSEDFNKFLKSLDDKNFKNSILGEEVRCSTRTIHNAKGLEFNQVLLFAKNFFDIKNNSAVLFLFYVAITRAKTELIIVDTENCINFKDFLRSSFKKKHVNIGDFIEVIKCRY